MSEKRQLLLMAKYNKLMNQRMIMAVEDVPTESLLTDKGAFFKSTLGTLNHILVGDILWLKRIAKQSTAEPILAFLSNIEAPQKLDDLIFDDISSLKEQRLIIDNALIKLTRNLEAVDLDTMLEYSNMKGEKHCKRLGDLILHLFLHQIHHRGQVTTLLSQESIDFGETDLVEII